MRLVAAVDAVDRRGARRESSGDDLRDVVGEGTPERAGAQPRDPVERECGLFRRAAPAAEVIGVEHLVADEKTPQRRRATDRRERPKHRHRGNCLVGALRRLAVQLEQVDLCGLGDP